MLEGPEETLFEHSPGVGREERPPNTVVVQLNQVLQYFVLLYWMVKCETDYLMNVKYLVVN